MGMGGGMGAGGVRSTIDGRVFDPARVDHTVTSATIEEWTIANSSPMDHPLHLHVWPMQVVAARGRPVDGVVWRDVVNVPAASELTVRIAFDRFSGRTVHHCPILDHEDDGRTGVLEAR